jgi:hypothetical protein
MRMLRALAAALAVAVLSVAATADPFPVVPPESVVLSSERLERISQHLRADVAKGTIPGAVMLISRRGKVAYFEAIGCAASWPARTPIA